MDRDTGRLRLRSLRETNELAGEQMQQEAQRFARIAGEDAPRVVESFNLFETPDRIARTMAGHVQPGARVLEPSAGLGRIVRAVEARGGDVLAVEVSPDCCRELYERHPTIRLRQRDFLACSADDLGGLFDFVVMNPPFKQGRDVKHIRHARRMLKPGGLLVALCFDGVRQNEQLRPEADSWEVLPADSFKQTGTRAGVAMLTMKA